MLPEFVIYLPLDEISFIGWLVLMGVLTFQSQFLEVIIALVVVVVIIVVVVVVVRSLVVVMTASSIVFIVVATSATLLATSVWSLSTSLEVGVPLKCMLNPASDVNAVQIIVRLLLAERKLHHL